MLDSYFFIPGGNPKYLNKISQINADYILIDLEDAVSVNNKQAAILLVMELDVAENMFVRIPFCDNSFSEKQITDLILKFKGKIVLPKIDTLHDVKQIVSKVLGVNLKMIVLIENPSSFLAVPEILKTFRNQIHAIGFGSHDFCSQTGIKHNLDYLSHYKRQLILYAKAFNIRYLDGVDLNLKNFSTFKKECRFAFDAGADGKFIIHPAQLKVLEEFDYMTETEIKQLKWVYNKVKNISINDIDVFTIEGKVYEKPHVTRIKYLMEKIERKYGNK
ncbi:aldolase/citrate lyase family protein [Winogradskyella sp.]|nr:aldolase/citrate lyase family protein [Winogradskyella sp.]